MVRFTENKRINPMIKIIGDMINKITPNDFISEKNSSFNNVMPVPRNTIKVLK